MASFDALQGTLAQAGSHLLSGFKAIESVQDVQSWLMRALCEYPNPAVKIASAALLASLIVFVLSIPTKKYSWVDKCWSVLPAVYAWTIALEKIPGAEMHPRLAIIVGLVTVWGCRLTYNFYRKGGYAWSGEDYRWPIVRRGMNTITFQVFNLFFIAIAQNLLLAAITSPIYVAWTATVPAGRRAIAPKAPLNAIDILATVLAASCLIIEAVADQQQWNFHLAKKAAGSRGRRGSTTTDVSKGFITTGLWKYSRHPNFFAEQAFWWSLCLFATAATGQWTGWWMAGVIALSALFQGSTNLTERITASKYPQYKEYQRTTSRLMPWFPSTATGATTPRRRRRSTSTGAQPAAAAVAEAPVEEPAVEEEVVAAPVARRGRAPAVRRASKAASTATTTDSSRSRSRSKSAPKKAPSVTKSASSAPSKSTASKSRSRSAPRSSIAKPKATTSTGSKPVRRSSRHTE